MKPEDIVDIIIAVYVVCGILMIAIAGIAVIALP